MSTFRPGECVTRRVALSKFLYAKLLYENFNPPRHSGFKLPVESHSDYSAHELGMKLVRALLSSFALFIIQIVHLPNVEQ